MPKMSRFNKIPWWLQALSGSGQNAQSPLSGAPGIRSIKRSSKDPQEVQRRLDELFDGSEIVKFYPIQVGVKPKDLIFGAHARGYERLPSEQIGEWAIEVYQKTKTEDENRNSTED